MKSLKKFEGFTLIEIMVAMVILAIGLLGMAMMTTLIMRGSKMADEHADATQVCQMKIEELKDVDWLDLGNWDTGGDPNDRFDWGEVNGSLVQEGSVDLGKGLNSQGLTRSDLFDSVEDQTGHVCFGVGIEPPTTSSSACAQFLNDAGPYKYALTFVICKGEDFVQSGGSWVPDTPLTSNGANTFVEKISGAMKKYTEPDCRVDEDVSTSRSKWLACLDGDIQIGAQEKKIKVLCAWRSRTGTCGSVHFDYTRVQE